MSQERPWRQGPKRRATIMQGSVGRGSVGRPRPLVAADVTRQSIYYSSRTAARGANRLQQERLNELDEVERAITRTLQGIDRNLSKCNSILTERVLPTLEKYNGHSETIFENVGHIKEFFENAADVNIVTEEEPEGENIMEAAAEELGTDTNVAATVSTGSVSDTGAAVAAANSRYRENFSDEPPVQEAAAAAAAADAADPSTPQTKRTADQAELSPVSAKKQFVDSLLSGYESPPWEEPPELESAKLLEQNPQAESSMLEPPDLLTERLDKPKTTRTSKTAEPKEQKAVCPPATATAPVPTEEPRPAELDVTISAADRVRAIEEQFGLDSDQDDEAPPELLTERLDKPNPFVE